MNLIKLIVISSTLGLGLAHADMASGKQAVNAACRAEASAAGCGDKQVGTGLLRCMHAYKKAHKEFVISEGCKSSTQALRSERKAQKAARAAK